MDNLIETGKSKPYLSFSPPGTSAASLLFRAAADANAKLMREKTIEERREATRAIAELRVIPTGLQFREANCGSVPCEWISAPDSIDEHVVLYLHGGSWTFGNRKTARAAGVLLCEATGWRVLVVEYRLAPEWPYPAAAQDCAAVYRWLVEEGYAPGQIVLFGDSAGGNLALGLLHQIREEGLPFPAAVGLAAPATDLTQSGMLCRGVTDLMYCRQDDKEQNLLDLYVGTHDRTNPLISPVYGDLSGFPPILIHVGGEEELLVDCNAFAQKMFAAGGAVSLKIWRDMFHDFSIVGNTLKESRLSIKEFAAFFLQYTE